MIRLIALIALLSSGALATAAPLRPSLIRDSTDVATFDPRIFAPGPNVDVYHLVVENPNPHPVTSLSLSLTSDGAFINQGVPNLSFRNSVRSPLLGPNVVAESYFVIPSNLSTALVLAVNTVDTADLLATNYAIQGGAELIPAGGSSVVAVLSIVTGSAVPDMSGWMGQAVINGVLERIAFIPEPTTGVLAGLALVGAARRRV